MRATSRAPWTTRPPVPYDTVTPPDERVLPKPIDVKYERRGVERGELYAVNRLLADSGIEYREGEEASLLMTRINAVGCSPSDFARYVGCLSRADPRRESCLAALEKLLNNGTENWRDSAMAYSYAAAAALQYRITTGGLC